MGDASRYGISLVLLRPLAQVIGRIGGAPERFMGDLGADSETTYVDAARVDDVLATLAAERGDPTFGLTLARTAVTYPLGFFDHLVWPGATVRDALERSSRFYALLMSRSTLVIKERAGDRPVRIVQQVAEGAPRGTVLTEFAFASLVLRARQAAGVFSARAMRFMHERARDTTAYADIFGAPVSFDQDADVLELDGSELDRPLGTADPIAAAALEAQAVRMTEALAPRDAFLDGVRAAILRGLRNPNSGLAELSRDLGVSERSVQRRLAEHGTTLRALVDDVRREVALRLIEEGASATTVAYEVGFARPQALHTVPVENGTCSYYDGCPADGQVAICVMKGMGHCWAGGAADLVGNGCPGWASATDLEWQFFKTFAW